MVTHRHGQKIALTVQLHVWKTTFIEVSSRLVIYQNLLKVKSLVHRHIGPRTVWTQDISAPSDWCRGERTVSDTSSEVYRRHSVLVQKCLDFHQTFF